MTPRSFADTLGALTGVRGPLPGFFVPDRPLHVARAPGRLDVMGGIADYSGALVLQWPLAEATWAAAQASEDGVVQVASVDPDDATPPRVARYPDEHLATLAAGSYDAAQQALTRDPDTAWAAYVLGVLLVLLREHDAARPSGLRLLVRSTVPEGKGVSSSAALEVAALHALSALLKTPLDVEELARLGQLAENRVVGAPCGIMDQMTAALGRSHHLLALLCQPAAVQGFVPVPPSLGLWGIDSGVRHAVSGADYTSVRVGAFMGYRIIADLAGLAVAEGPAPGVQSVEDPHWHGYLANLAPATFAERFADRLPDTLTGAAFLERYGGTTDPVTRVDPGRTYRVRRPTAHPIYEHARVQQFRALLAGDPDEAARRTLGALMYASHASYSACGLGSDATDRLVALVEAAGPDAGLYGAKITGGGSGGTVAVLGRADAGPTVAALARRYRDETGRGGTVFAGSSDGAGAFGVHTLNGLTGP